MYLELFCPRCRDLDIDVLVEHDGNVVVLPPFQLLPTIDLQLQLLLRIEIQSILQKLPHIFVLCKNEEVDTEHPVDLSNQIVEVN